MVTTLEAKSRVKRSDPGLQELSAAPIERVSQRVQRFGAWYARRYIRKHLHALRMRVAAENRVAPEIPIIVYLNHPSWWDPLVALVVAHELFPDRRHCAPIDAQALSRYRILERFGFFGVDRTRLRGAVDFLQTAQTICSSAKAALWITPQGRFVDVRDRPVALATGLGRLVARLDRAVVIPMAIEYVFWEERTAEALVLVGRRFVIDREGTTDHRKWTLALARRLEETQDELASLSVRRNPEQFRTLVRGRAGVGGVYDRWRSFLARVRGRSFKTEHGDLDP